MKIIKYTLTLILVCFVLSNAYAEPYYFHPKLISIAKERVDNIDGIDEKIEYINDVSEKIDLITNNKKVFFLRDLEEYKKALLKGSIREYTYDKYIYGKTEIDIDQYKSSYKIIKSRDLKAATHINYLLYIENLISKNGKINEDSTLYKAYIYIIYYTKKSDNNKTTISKLNEMSSFMESKNYLENKEYFNSLLQKLKNKEEINLYSKNDFTKIYSKIIKENISPGSDYMMGFLTWYARYNNILGNSLVTLDHKVLHNEQKYNLSCEANSTKDLLNYYNKKYGKIFIEEDEILESLSSNTGGIINSGDGLIWHDPNKVFVGSVDGKQSSSINRFSGYGVYADPIISAINKVNTNRNISFEKGNFSEENILESIGNGNPVMFWYLSKVRKGSGYAYNTKPITWKTQNGKIINGYIGEHVGVIFGIDISKDGNIENIYFYEGRNKNIQKMSFVEAQRVASFFDEIIVGKIKETKENKYALKTK